MDLMRARNLKPGFFSDERVTNCCFSARILFQGLWCLADMDGILRERVKEIKAKIFPRDSISVEKCLAQLEKEKLIIRYVVDGEKFIAIRNFRKHQKPYSNEAPSRLPKPPKPITNRHPTDTQPNPNRTPTDDQPAPNRLPTDDQPIFSGSNAESISAENQTPCETGVGELVEAKSAVPCSLSTVHCLLSPVPCSPLEDPPPQEEKKPTSGNTVQTQDEPFQGPTVKEKEGFDYSFEGLAKHFWESQKGGKETLDVVDETMEELIRVGFSPTRIREEIDNPERLATQRTWEFSRPFKDQLRDRKKPRVRSVEERMREHMARAKASEVRK